MQPLSQICILSAYDCAHLRQVLDPQELPFNEARWYNASHSQESGPKGFVDAMWDGDGTLMHKALGKSLNDVAVPQLERPRDWSGARMTQVVSRYWPQIEANFFGLMDSGTAAKSWRGTRRVVLVQSGSWYKMVGGGKYCYTRLDLCKLPGDKLVKVFYAEATHALRAMDAWAAAHAHNALQVFVANVACRELRQPCNPGFHKGLKKLVAGRGSSLLQYFDLSAVAAALPGERVQSHPSLMASAWLYNTLLTMASDTAAPGCGEQQYVKFDKACYSKGMVASCVKCKTWLDAQHTPCGYRDTMAQPARLLL